MSGEDEPQFEVDPNYSPWATRSAAEIIADILAYKKRLEDEHREIVWKWWNDERTDQAGD